MGKADCMMYWRGSRFDRHVPYLSFISEVTSWFVRLVMADAVCLWGLDSLSVQVSSRVFGRQRLADVSLLFADCPKTRRAIRGEGNYDPIVASHFDITDARSGLGHPPCNLRARIPGIVRWMMYSSEDLAIRRE